MLGMNDMLSQSRKEEKVARACTDCSCWTSIWLAYVLEHLQQTRRAQNWFVARPLSGLARRAALAPAAALKCSARRSSNVQKIQRALTTFFIF